MLDTGVTKSDNTITLLTCVHNFISNTPYTNTTIMLGTIVVVSSMAHGVEAYPTPNQTSIFIAPSYPAITLIFSKQ